MKKLEGYEFWEQTLGKASLVVAPMVDQSELPWRILSRRHGAHLCYSPMYHAQMFMKDRTLRKEALTTCPEDRPLIVQFCANKPEVFVQAAKLAEPYCDAIDLNLGCPQSIAKRGHYGAFLEDDWDLIFNILNQAHKELSVPVTCKIRVFDDIDRTVQYAQMIERAGVQLITVHGRTREMKGPFTGMADWKAIKAVKQALKIPVFANGNIQSLDDINRCFAETGVDGIMTAVGNLHNPALFEGTHPPIWEVALEYLNIVKEHPVSLSYVRGHLFKLWLHMLEKHTHLREALGKARSVDVLEQICYDVKNQAEKDMKEFEQEDLKEKKIPHWLCQPFLRPSPEEFLKRAEERAKNPKRKIDQQDQRRKNKVNKTSPDPRVRKKVKADRPICAGGVPRGEPALHCGNSHGENEKYDKCVCKNPRGLRCVFQLCRTCCKVKAHNLTADCPSHSFMFESKEKRRKHWEAVQRAKQETESKDEVKGNTLNRPEGETLIEKSEVNNGLQSAQVQNGNFQETVVSAETERTGETSEKLDSSSNSVAENDDRLNIQNSSENVTLRPEKSTGLSQEEIVRLDKQKVT